jgi:hypothetical protein
LFFTCKNQQGKRMGLSLQSLFRPFNGTFRQKLFSLFVLILILEFLYFFIFYKPRHTRVKHQEKIIGKIFKCLSGEKIPFGKVNDGHCDCCDGSDESKHLVECPNICPQTTFWISGFILIIVIALHFFGITGFIIYVICFYYRDND